MTGMRQDSKLKPGIRTLRLLHLMSMVILFYPQSYTDAFNRTTAITATIAPLTENIYSTNITFTEIRVESSIHDDINDRPPATTVKLTTSVFNAVHDSSLADKDDLYPEFLDDGGEEEDQSEDDDDKEISSEYGNDVNVSGDEMSTSQYYYYDDHDFFYPHDITAAIYNSINIIIAFTGTIGNILVSITWSKVKHANSTAFLLSFLGIVDFVFVLFMLFTHIYFMSTFHFTYTTSWLFYFTVYLSYTAQYLSIFTTALVSITRYIAVKSPFKFKNWFKNSIIKVILVILTGVSFLLALPASSVSCLYLYFFEDLGYEDYSPENYTFSENNNSQPSHGPSKFYGAVDSWNFSDKVNTVTPLTSHTPVSGEFAQEPQYMNEIEVCRYTSEDLKKIFLIITATMMNVVPWIVVIPMNLLLINQVRKSFKERKHMLSKEEQNNSTMDIVVLIVSLQSILAYPCFFSIELLTNRLDWAYYFGGEPPLAIPTMDSSHVTSLKDCFHIINSSLNIVAYCACGRRFRKILMQDVFKCAPGKPRSAGNTSKEHGVETNEQKNSGTSDSGESQTTQELASQDIRAQ